MRIERRLKLAIDRGKKTEEQCWRWRGLYRLRRKHRVPYIWIDGVLRPAQRFLYEYYVGPIPAGLEIIATCGHRWCANWHHFKPVTHSEAMLFAWSTYAKRRKK